MKYLIRRVTITPELKGLWDGPAWNNADVATVDQFRAESSDHRPRTQAKMMYDRRGLYVHFRVDDRYVVCTRTENQELTSKDSCVEVYLEPIAEGDWDRVAARTDEMQTDGYINFEMNCGGTILTFFITDPTRCEPGIFEQKVVIPQTLIDTMRIYHSMPKKVWPQIVEPVRWSVEYFVPWSCFEAYFGKLNVTSGTRWRGNFFKCADESSHPHWASWNPIGPAFNFHVPKYFAEMIFE